MVDPASFEMEAGRGREHGHPGAKRSGIWEEIAMKTALLFVAGIAVATLSIVPRSGSTINGG
jgi:hypothetical protein